MSRSTQLRQKQQQGNVLIITLFVIIVMGYLAASLLRVTWSNQSSLTREYLGTQAWFIAQSTGEWALTEVYPINTTVDVSTACSTINSATAPVSIATGTSCRVDSLSCQFIGSLQTGPSEAESLFRIKTTAICGSGVSQVQRQQEVWVRDVE